MIKSIYTILILSAWTHTTLRYDVVAGHTECSDIVALSREFDSRLFKHFDYYGEDIDVPGAVLPYPFNTRQNTVIRMNSKVHSSNEELRDICQPFPEEVCDLPNPELSKLYNKWKITDSPDLFSVDSLRKELPSLDELS
uniref:uncharacterized protein LOC122598490 n=1 Tax=Erigeron canadensis TaxID=72917 RepID=UPI001CB94651|nr:uncharacterized protein LOC122598490 [Erigeron canadensis]